MDLFLPNITLHRNIIYFKAAKSFITYKKNQIKKGTKMVCLSLILLPLKHIYLIFLYTRCDKKVLGPQVLPVTRE